MQTERLALPHRQMEIQIEEAGETGELIWRYWGTAEEAFNVPDQSLLRTSSCADT